MSTNLAGTHEIEATKYCVYLAEEWEATCKMLVRCDDTELASAKLKSAQEAVKKAKAMQRETENRWQVLNVDSDDEMDEEDGKDAELEVEEDEATQIGGGGVNNTATSSLGRNAQAIAIVPTSPPSVRPRVRSTSSEVTPTIMDLNAILRVLKRQNNVVYTVIFALRQLKILISEKGVKEIVRRGSLPPLVHILFLSDCSCVLSHAMYALGIAARRGYTKAVISAGAVPRFTYLLSSPSKLIRRQSALILSIIAIDSTGSSKYILEAGCLRPLVRNVVESGQDITAITLEIFIMCLSSICVWKENYIALSELAPTIPILVQILNCNRKDLVEHSLPLISKIVSGHKDRRQAAIDDDLVNNAYSIIRRHGNLRNAAVRHILTNLSSAISSI